MGNEDKNLEKELSQLNADIRKAEETGVNTKLTRSLYEEAASLLNEGKEQDARTKIGEAYGDIARKQRLLKSSKSGFIFGCVLILIIISLFVLFNFVNAEGLRYQKVLTVPLFTIAWGLIGCATYIAYTTYVKIREKIFDWYDLNSYLFRFVLAVFFAGFTYVLAINGLITLPGTVGKEVKASIAAKELSQREVEGPPGTSNDSSVKVMEVNGSVGSFLEIAKNAGGLTAEAVKGSAAYAGILEKPVVAKNGIYEVSGIISKHGADGGKTLVETETDVGDALTRVVERVDEPKRPDEIETEIKNLDKDIADINGDTKDLKENLYFLTHPEFAVEAELGEEQTLIEAKAEHLDEISEEVVVLVEDIEEKAREAARIEALRVAKEAELEVAREREQQAPIWESWIFILVAFISGFSVEFSAGLVERVRELFLSTAGGKKDK